MIDIVIAAEMMRVREDVLAVKIPDQSHALLIAYVIDKSRGKQINIRIGRYYPKRTTGKYSQNHAINGFAQQIAIATGNEFQDVKDAAKERAIKRGYPFRTVCGRVKPWHEHELNMIQAGYLIDELKQIAAEEGIRLIEIRDMQGVL